MQLSLRTGYGTFIRLGVPLTPDSGDVIDFAFRSAEEKTMLQNNADAYNDLPAVRTQAVIYTNYSI